MVFRPLVQQPGTIAPEVKGGFRPITPDASKKLDQEAPIENHNEQGVFDGSTYDDGAGWSPENTDLYNSIGQETLGGMGPRLQQTTNDEGAKRTYLVPAPTTSKTPIDNVTESVARTVVGGGLEAAKGTAGFGEWMMDQFMQDHSNDPNRPKSYGPETVIGPALKSVASFADQLLGTQFSDAEKNWIDENFPTLPPQNDWEKMGQEITSIVIGGMGGAAAAGTAGKGLSSVGKKIAEIGTDFFRRADATDMANAAQKTQVFIGELVKELAGMNVGATIATPTDVDSISGNLMPETIGDLSADETNKVGHMIDNTVISGLFNLVGRPIANAGGKLVKTFFGGGKNAPVSSDVTQQTAIDVMREIDPGLANVSPEEFKRRSVMFSNMIADNSEADVGSLGTFVRGPVTTTIKGADQYVENAYGYLRRSMTAEQWETFKKQHSALITDNIIAMRRDNMANTTVQSADARINDQASSIMAKTADDLGGLRASIASGQELGGQVKSQIDSATDMVNLPNQNATIAQGQLEYAQNKDVIMSELAGAKSSGLLGQTPEQRAFLNNLSGEQLYENWTKSYENYNNLFDQVPDTPIGSETAMDIARIIAEAGDDQTISDLTRISGAGNMIKPLPDVGMHDIAAGAQDPLMELAHQWEGQSLKSIFNKVRPYLSDTLNSADRAGSFADKSGVVDLKKFIDSITLESDDPSFKAAMDAYKDHMGTFGAIDDMNAYNQAAQGVYQSGAQEIGRKQLNVTAAGMMQDALYGGDTSGEKLNAMIDALGKNNPDFQTEELADAVVSSALARVAAASGTDGVSSQALINAVQPILPALERLSPDAVAAWEKTVAALQGAEVGSVQAKAAVAAAEAQSVILKANAEKRAAYKFLEQNADGLQVLPAGDITTQFNNIFKTEAATRDLMNQARLSDDPMVLSGVQAQYLSYLKDRVFTNVPISSNGIGGAVPGSSGTNLGKMLEGSDVSAMGVLNEVFKDNPAFADDLLMLLEEVRLDHVSRSIKPQTFSSNTVVDDTRRKALNTLITMTLGTLNRTAATTRNIVNNVTGVQMDAQKQQIEQITAALLVDSKFLTATLDRLGDRPTRDAYEDGARALLEVINNGMGGAGGSMVRATSTSVGDRTVNQDVRTEDAQTKPDLARQTEDAFSQ